MFGCFFLFFSFVDNLFKLNVKFECTFWFRIFLREIQIVRMWERKPKKIATKQIRTEHNMILRNRLKKRSNTELYTDLVVSANPYAHVQQTKKDETDEAKEEKVFKTRVVTSSLIQPLLFVGIGMRLALILVSLHFFFSLFVSFENLKELMHVCASVYIDLCFAFGSKLIGKR